MPNRMTLVLDRIVEACQALVTAGTLREVDQRIMVADVDAAPALGVAISRFSRQKDQALWEVEVSLMLLTASGRNISAGALEAAIAIDGVIEALADSPDSVGTIDKPMWDPWYHVTNEGRFQCHGALGSLRVTLDHPATL